MEDMKVSMADGKAFQTIKGAGQSMSAHSRALPSSLSGSNEGRGANGVAQVHGQDLPGGGDSMSRAHSDMPSGSSAGLNIVMDKGTAVK